jgi:hypothetical protein
MSWMALFDAKGMGGDVLYTMSIYWYIDLIMLERPDRHVDGT